MHDLPLDNTALIHDEVLMEIIKVIEGDWPAGPEFLYAFGSLVEAAVIHDTVFYDPLRQTQRKDFQLRETIPEHLNRSEFVQQLIRENVLTLLPKHDQLDSQLEASGSTYRSDDFLVDYYYGIESFSSNTPEAAVADHEVLTDLLANAPRVLLSDTLIQSEAGDEAGGFMSLTAEGVSAFTLGFTRPDMIRIETLVRRARGYLELTQSLGIDFYPVFGALPYQVGAIKSHTSKAKELFDSVIKKSTALDEPIQYKNNFSRVPIPPLAQIVMANSKDSIKALVSETMALRERHGSFRNYLTSYQRDWNRSSTRAERISLRKDFDNAWNAFVTKTERPSTRLVYSLWDIFKNPANILAEVGDKLRAKGHELSIIGKVRGLHDFWSELAGSPVPEKNAELLRKLFPRLAPEKEWQVSKALADTTNAFLNQTTQTANNPNQTSRQIEEPTGN